MTYQPEIFCADCGVNDVHSRGLCTACYVRNKRRGTLDEYPVQPYLDDPAKYAHWLIEHDLDVLRDTALDRGYVLVPYDEYQTMKG